MIPQSVMLIAGEASGDALAGGLVRALKELAGARQFFGAGGPKMAEAGVEVVVDMMPHSAIGIDAIKHYATFRAIFNQLLTLAKERQPDLIVLVDFGHFNQGFARAIRKFLATSKGVASNWRPKIVRYVSPQVWASRPGRAQKLARDIDLLLCLFPFEKDWYAQRVPQLRVEFVGHPICDRPRTLAPEKANFPEGTPLVLLLPGSRRAELKRHLPAILGAAQKIAAAKKVRFKMVLPDEKLKPMALPLCTNVPDLEIQIGGLVQALSQAALAISKTGTVTLECAYFGVPTVTFYIASWITFQIGKRIVKVKSLTMPNLLADEEVFPEFIQTDATPENLARAALDLLNSPARQSEIKGKLQDIVASLGGSGASKRAAQAILKMAGEA